MSSNLMIGKKEYVVKESELLIRDLRFYPDNPRLYSLLGTSEEEPSQNAIETKLLEMDHVKQLSYSIRANGGLIDPIIVRDGDFVVLEGNSRLAAYRSLAKSSREPDKWLTIKCKVLPKDIPDNAIFTLLGQYHIIGRKDWSPYEQAGYLYRRQQLTQLSIDSIAKELGLTAGVARSYFDTYSFMKTHEDMLPEHWSYYDEYLKNRGIKKYRDTHAAIDSAIANQIKVGEIKAAIDIRDVLGKVANLDDQISKKAMKEVIEGKCSIYDAHERVQSSGKLDPAFQVLKKFKTKLLEPTFKAGLIEGSEANYKAVCYELKKIKSRIDKLYEEFKEKADQI